MSAPIVALALALLLFALSRALRPARHRRRSLLPRCLVVAIILFVLLAPPFAPATRDAAGLASVLSLPQPAAAETLADPQYIDVAVMPNGQVGTIFQNGYTNHGDIRFKRYFAEQGLDPAVQLSATSWNVYPQLATFQAQFVSDWVESSSGVLIFRTSTDDGATWSAPFQPFGTTTFSPGNYSPLLVTSRDGTKLYVFACCDANSHPTYSYTTDATLATWTAFATTGDASMHAVSNNNCGNSGQECYRAHLFEFTELPSGSWLFITKSASGYGQSGRGTQVGTLGGAWSTQVDLGGSGGISGCCGESRATAFVDRNGYVFYVRADSSGRNVYYQRSTDGGYSWGRAYTRTATRSSRTRPARPSACTSPATPGANTSGMPASAGSSRTPAGSSRTPRGSYRCGLPRRPTRSPGPRVSSGARAVSGTSAPPTRIPSASVTCNAHVLSQRRALAARRAINSDRPVAKADELALHRVNPRHVSGAVRCRTCPQSSQGGPRPCNRGTHQDLAAEVLHRV